MVVALSDTSRGGGNAQAPAPANSTSSLPSLTPAAGGQDFVVTATVPQASDVSAGTYVFGPNRDGTPRTISAAPIVPNTVADAGLDRVVAPGAAGNKQVAAAVTAAAAGPDGSQRVAVDLYGDRLLSFAVDPSIGRDIAGAGRTMLAAGTAVTLQASVAEEVVRSSINLRGVRQANGFLVHDGRLVLVFIDSATRIAAPPSATAPAPKPGG
jgi:hypothetical protein